MNVSHAYISIVLYYRVIQTDVGAAAEEFEGMGLEGGEAVWKG